MYPTLNLYLATLPNGDVWLRLVECLSGGELAMFTSWEEAAYYLKPFNQMSFLVWNEEGEVAYVLNPATDLTHEAFWTSPDDIIYPLVN